MAIVEGCKVKKVPCECYSRIVGYYRPIRNWNQGAQQQHKDRKMYDVPPEVRGG